MNLLISNLIMGVAWIPRIVHRPWLAPSLTEALRPWHLYHPQEVKIPNPHFEINKKIIAERVNHISKAFGIKKTLEVVYLRDSAFGGYALGNTLLPGKAGIAMSALNTITLKEHEFEWYIAHEISHIVNHDILTMSLFSGIIGHITILALSILIPAPLTFSPLWISCVTIAGIFSRIIGISLFSSWRELMADKTAFSVCSDEAKLAAIKFHKKICESNISHKQMKYHSCFSALRAKFRYTDAGGDRLDICHPYVDVVHATMLEWLKQG